MTVLGTGELNLVEKFYITVLYLVSIFIFPEMSLLPAFNQHKIVNCQP